MTGFKEISNSALLYGLVMIGLLYVAFFCAVFMKKAYARCLELGITKDKVKGVIKSSIAFSIVPSFAIVIGFVSLSAALGVPWSWWRLSIIGSVGYELMAAEMAAKGVGYSDLAAMAAANDSVVFGAVMFIMTIGIMAGMTLLIFAGKKLTTGLVKARTSTQENSWGMVMSSCFMLTLGAVFMPVMIFSNAVYTATLLTSAGMTVLLGTIAKKYHIKWLPDFILAITLIVSMMASVVWQAIL